MTLVQKKPAGVDADEGGRSGRARRILLLAARVVFTLAVVVAVVYATASQWAEVHAYLLGLAWPSVLLSLVMVLIGIAAATMGWRAALAAIGPRIPVRTAGQVYLIGLMAKYLPGSVWAFVLQMELGKRAKLTRSRPLLASLVLTGIGTTVSLAMGLFALPALREVSGVLALAVVILVPVALVCAHPKILTWLLRRVMIIGRRPVEVPPISWRGLAPVVGWSLVTGLSFGVHLWLLASAGATPGAGGIFRCIGAIALGLTLGMLAFLAPSGLGVREAIVVAALVPYTTSGAALGMALASRMIFTIADLIAAGAAGASSMKLRRLIPARSWAPGTGTAAGGAGPGHRQPGPAGRHPELSSTGLSSSPGRAPGGRAGSTRAPAWRRWPRSAGRGSSPAGPPGARAPRPAPGSR